MKTLLIIILTGLLYVGSKAQNALPVPSLQLTIEKAESQAVILKWNAISKSVIGFVVEKKEGDGPWLIVGQTDSNEMSFTDKEVSRAAIAYRVRSFGHRVFSDYSNIMAMK
jgi:hypothetical protein